MSESNDYGNFIELDCDINIHVMTILKHRHPKTLFMDRAVMKTFYIKPMYPDCITIKEMIEEEKNCRKDKVSDESYTWLNSLCSFLNSI